MDIVLRNAKVDTSDEQQPWADTIAIRDGRFVHVGQEADWSGGESFIVHDVGGRLVLPGLIDSHTHPSRDKWSRDRSDAPWHGHQLVARIWRTSVAARSAE